MHNLSLKNLGLSRKLARPPFPKALPKFGANPPISAKVEEAIKRMKATGPGKTGTITVNDTSRIERYLESMLPTNRELMKLSQPSACCVCDRALTKVSNPKFTAVSFACYSSECWPIIKDNNDAL